METNKKAITSLLVWSIVVLVLAGSFLLYFYYNINKSEQRQRIEELVRVSEMPYDEILVYVKELDDIDELVELAKILSCNGRYLEAGGVYVNAAENFCSEEDREYLHLMSLAVSNTSKQENLMILHVNNRNYAYK